MRRLLLALALLYSGPASAEKPELYTNAYIVPPYFLAHTSEARRPTAREVLDAAGIDFPEGASAVYNPGASQLIVRTTGEQMALVEAYIESIRAGVSKQVYVTVLEFEFAEKPDLSSDFGPLMDQPQGTPLLFDERAQFLEALSHPPQEITGARLGIVGVFTDPQFQILLSNLGKSQKASEPPASLSAAVRSAAPLLLQEGRKRWGIIPTIGIDEFTIDLELFLPEHGESFFPDGPGSRNPITVTIWDGQTVACSEEKEDGSYRVVFVTARMIDPAGRPIHGAQADEKPDAP